MIKHFVQQKDLIGYYTCTKKLCFENIRKAEKKWIERKNHINQSNINLLNTEKKTSNTFINWNIYDNLLFSKSENKNKIITPNHIMTLKT